MAVYISTLVLVARQRRPKVFVNSGSSKSGTIFLVPDFDLHCRFTSNSMYSSLPMIVPCEPEHAESLDRPVSAYQKKGHWLPSASP